MFYFTLTVSERRSEPGPELSGYFPGHVPSLTILNEKESFCKPRVKKRPRRSTLGLDLGYLEEYLSRSTSRTRPGRKDEDPETRTGRNGPRDKERVKFE